MYDCSQNFHDCIKSGEPQMALLLFTDGDDTSDWAVFGNHEISQEQGIDFHDYFCNGEQLTIGQTLCNNISFSLLNDERKLNTYPFGKFAAFAGVRVNSGTYTQASYVQVKQSSTVTYYGNMTKPYLKKNSAVLSHQPTFPVVSMLSFNGKLYCFGSNSEVFAINMDNDSVADTTLNNYMKSKVKQWNGKGFRWYSGRMLEIWSGGIRERYEFVPFGTFIAERPSVVRTDVIEFTCNDQMSLFDEDMPGSISIANVSFQNIVKALCNHVGVPYDLSGFTINQNATVTSKPEELDDCTMRECLGWLAEAGCANAKFNRDGKLVFVWYKDSSSQTIDESMYSEFSPCWYQTKGINKLVCRNTSKGTDKTKGSGSNAYLIQDNPFLKGAD